MGLSEEVNDPRKICTHKHEIYNKLITLYFSSHPCGLASILGPNRNEIM